MAVEPGLRPKTGQAVPIRFYASRSIGDVAICIKATCNNGNRANASLPAPPCSMLADSRAFTPAMMHIAF
ncbi:hypothetical protein [Lampropedia cohaerens]|uniref:hypothetical protein n=1 Tax=Lampropedia cohaerens TaxID=1610491 RepID=UPI0012E34BA7|nr:hypothetical protein [Lampropedia cohaerens]